jgi:hypothetical protein
MEQVMAKDVVNGRIGFRPAKQMVIANTQKCTVRDMIPAVILLGLGLSGLLIASFWPYGRTGQYLVLASPSSTLGQTINLVRGADGGLIETSRFSNILIASSNRSSFAADLRKAGALLVIAVSVPVGCSDGATKGAWR